MRIIQNWKSVIRGGPGAFSVFRLARRELGGELAIYSQVLGKHFLAEGFLFYGADIKQDVHPGS